MIPNKVVDWTTSRLLIENDNVNEDQELPISLDEVFSERGGDEDGRLQLLQFFRVALRRPATVEWFCQEEEDGQSKKMTWLFDFLFTEENTPALANEASLCAINLLRSLPATRLFIQRGLAKILLDTLSQSVDKLFSLPKASNMLILCTLAPDLFAACADESRLVVSLARALHAELSSADAYAEKSSIFVIEDEDAHATSLKSAQVPRKQFILDILRVLFHFTQHWGMLGDPKRPPNSEICTDYEELLKLIIPHLVNSACRNETEREISLAASHCLVSCSDETAQHIFRQMSADRCIGIIDCRLKAKKNVKKIGTVEEVPEEEEEEQDVRWILLPMIAWSRSLQLCPELRRSWKELVFPSEIYDRVQAGVAPPVDDMKLLSNRLAAQLLTVNDGIVYYISEFLFQLCEESPDELTRLVGLGCAGGFLVTRGFMSTKGAFGNQEESSVSDTGKRESGDDGRGGGGAERQEKKDDENISKEEKDRLMRQLLANPEGESEDTRIIRMGRAMHDLEKANVLKLVRKGDKPAAATSEDESKRRIIRDERHCWHCGKESETMKQCSKCKKAKYCSADHQRSDWLRHRNECAETTKKPEIK